MFWVWSEFKKEEQRTGTSWRCLQELLLNPLCFLPFWQMALCLTVDLFLSLQKRGSELQFQPMTLPWSSVLNGVEGVKTSMLKQPKIVTQHSSSQPLLIHSSKPDKASCGLMKILEQVEEFKVQISVVKVYLNPVSI